MSKQKIRFIANPRSGPVRRRNLPLLIAKHLDHGRFDHELCHTGHAGHAAELAAEAVQLGFDLVVACGGDGSVNEVAGQLIGTGAVLGVVPCGSGNGFAGHLGLGRDVAGAIRTLSTGRAITVDSCTLNGRPYVNLAGVGFDGAVARRLHESRVRGLWAYLRFTLEEAWRYQAQLLDIQLDGTAIRRRCLFVEVANAPIYGYGFRIVPEANFEDGKLEVLLVRAAPLWRYVLSSWRFLNDSFHRSRLAETFQCEEVVVSPSKPIGAHIDGEGFELGGEARFGIRPASLRVIVPQ